MLLLHMRDNLAGEINRAQKVRLDRSLPVVKRGRQKPFSRRASRIGHANVRAAELAGHGGNESGDSSRVGNINRFGEHFNAVLLSDFFCGGLQRLLISSAHSDAATLGGEGLGGGKTESLTGRRHQGDAVFQTQIHERGIINGDIANSACRTSCGGITLKDSEVPMKRRFEHPETQATRGSADLQRKNGPLATPIYQTSTFEVTDNEEQLRVTGSDSYYTRYGNPTNTAAEKTVAELEGVDGALTFSSGMGAITTTIMALLKAGDHIVAQREVYGGTHKFLSQWLPKLGIETTFVDTTDYDQHARAIRPSTKLLYLESPTNPTLRVVDLNKTSALAKQYGLLSMIDSTFGTPINQHPAEFGIDLIMHSGTKYLSGHSDLICGVVAGRSELIEKILSTRTTIGNCMDPHAAWMLLRGLKTLAVRVQRQNENALRVAEFLSNHAKVHRVHYPFLKSHPQFAVARSQMAGGGGMVSFEVEGTGDDARRLTEALRLFTLAPSLGGVESLVSIPVLTSHLMVPAEERQKIGVTEQMIRLSVGIESAEDLIEDLEHALEAVGARQSVSVG
jgi:cystathionine beta-lyase/cystathionine gamma-synthase